MSRNLLLLYCFATVTEMSINETICVNTEYQKTTEWVFFHHVVSKWVICQNTGAGSYLKPRLNGVKVCWCCFTFVCVRWRGVGCSTFLLCAVKSKISSERFSAEDQEQSHRTSLSSFKITFNGKIVLDV